MILPLLIPLITTIAGGALTAFTTGVLASIGLSFLISGALQIVGSLFSTSPGIGGFKGSPTYGWDNLSNFRGAGGVRQVVYGEHAIRPQVVSTNLFPSDEGPVLHLLCHGSQGLCDVATMRNDWKDRIRINGIPGGDIDGLDVQFTPGTDTQEALDGFDEIGRPFSASTKLEKDVVHEHSMRAAGNGAKFFFTWPGGIYKVSRKGKTTRSCGPIKIEYRKVGGAGWRSVAIIEPKVTPAATATAIKNGSIPYVDLGEHPDWSRTAPSQKHLERQAGWFWT